MTSQVLEQWGAHQNKDMVMDVYKDSVTETNDLGKNMTKNFQVIARNAMKQLRGQRTYWVRFDGAVIEDEEESEDEYEDDGVVDGSDEQKPSDGMELDGSLKSAVGLPEPTNVASPRNLREINKSTKGKPTQEPQPKNPARRAKAGRPRATQGCAHIGQPRNDREKVLSSVSA